MASGDAWQRSLSQVLALTTATDADSEEQSKARLEQRWPVGMYCNSDALLHLQSTKHPQAKAVRSG
jgi:hypothetical protein